MSLGIEDVRAELARFSKVQLSTELENVRHQIVRDITVIFKSNGNDPVRQATKASEFEDTDSSQFLPWPSAAIAVTDWQPDLWTSLNDDEPVVVDKPTPKKDAARTIRFLKSSGSKDSGYSLIPSSEDDYGNDGNGTYPSMNQYTSEARSGLQRKLDDLARKEEEVTQHIEDHDKHWHSRVAPFRSNLNEILHEKTQIELQLAVNIEFRDDGLPPPTGPKFFQWVDSSWFSAICNILVAANLASMAVHRQFPAYKKELMVVDELFLVWYVFELSSKTLYRRSDLFVGSLSVVWWNWLDLLIVISGIVDQWVLPVAKYMTGTGSGGVLPIPSTALRSLRFLRLFRVMRVLKLVKSFVFADLSWTDGACFDTFMSVVICLNAVVMSAELDYEDYHFVWRVMEHLFLIVYSFELVLRLKRWGCEFFYHSDNGIWNNLDLIIVSGGVTDLWLLPGICLLQTTITGSRCTLSISNLGSILSLFRIMRLLRILRLVRLVRAIKPLYRLLQGVMEALRAMQWVLIMTLIVLYAAAILFTSCIGKGYLYGGTPPHGATDLFDTVPRSLFSLFRLMNGDIDIVDPICHSLVGQLLFISFMVLSNWAILAILTSVVSDNMIACSTRTIMEDESAAKEEEVKDALRRLKTLFSEIDTDKSGCISDNEWLHMLNDQGLRGELTKVTGMNGHDLEDFYTCYSSVGPSGDKRILNYRNFIENVKQENSQVDKRSILKIMTRLRTMEHRFEKSLGDLQTCL